MKPVSEVPMQHGTPVVVKHGPIYTDKRALETILRWCDRGGEEPEGLCLHEIEQICRKQLGLELLVPSEPLPESEDTKTVRHIWETLGISSYADLRKVPRRIRQALRKVCA